MKKNYVLGIICVFLAMFLISVQGVSAATFKINGFNYNVNLDAMGADFVKVAVEGYLSPEMSEQTQPYTPIRVSDLYLIVKDMGYQEFGGGVKEATVWVGGELIINLNEEKEVEIDGESYKISLIYIDSKNDIKLRVNNGTSSTKNILQENPPYYLHNYYKAINLQGLDIIATDMIYQNFAGGKMQATLLVGKDTDKLIGGGGMGVSESPLNETNVSNATINQTSAGGSLNETNVSNQTSINRCKDASQSFERGIQRKECTLSKNEIVTTNVNTLSIEIILISIDSSKVQFEVNGDQTPQMQEGDLYTIIDQKFEGGLGKIELTVDDIVYQDFAGGIQHVEVSVVGVEGPGDDDSDGRPGTGGEAGVSSCSGCELDGKCYSFGYRKSGKYCSDNNEFINYLEERSVCDNNFECKSNVCVDDECISGGLIKSIINWFKRIFGKE